MKIVAFYTPHYEGQLEAWVETIRPTGIPYFVTCRADAGNWRLNVGMKPVFLLDCLEQFKEPILWIDIDGRVRGDLALAVEAFDKYDFGAWFIPWDQMQPAHRPGGAKTKNDGISSGTMYWNYTPDAIEFLKMWIAAEHGQHRYGQIVLGEVWHDFKPAALRTWRMPQAWFKVFDRPWKVGESGPIIIEHFQASRKLRRD